MGWLTPAQIEAAMTALAAPPSPPDGLCTKSALPNKTVSEGIGPTTYSFLKIGKGTDPARVTVLAIAGMHAREWAQPDAVISFVQKLLAAYRGSTAFVIPAYSEGGNTYGPVSVAKDKIKAMLDRLDILLVPLANPDGRAFSQAALANKDWRKNRAPRPPGGSDDTVGVDLNRNFDIGWDFDTFYSAAFIKSGVLHSSKDPADETFIGNALPAPQSSHPNTEPEGRNLIWLLDHFPVTYSVDLHCYLLKVMYPWGIEQNGTVATQNFRNHVHDRGGSGPERDGTPGTAYSEFFPNVPPSRLKDQHDTIVKSMCDRIRAATGRRYHYGGIADVVYPATGSFTDFHFSRQFTIAGSPEIHAFAAEFGTEVDTFQPDYTAPTGFPRIEREVHALLLAMLEAALPSPPPAPSGSTAKKKCFFTVAAGDFAAGMAWLETLRRGRAVGLAGARTRAAMLAIERMYHRMGDPLIPLIAHRLWARRAVAYGIVAPAAMATALALKWSAQ